MTGGVFQPVHADSGFFNYDAFVSKFSPDGANLLYSTFFCGFGDDFGRTIAVNAGGEAFVGGFTNGGAIPTTPGAYDQTFAGAPGFADMFVFRLAADAGSLIYSTFIGGSESESVNDIVVNEANEASFTGEVNSPNFPTTPGALQSNRTGVSACACAVRLSADGSQLLASTYVCGNRGDYGEALAIDDAGNFYLTGRTYSDLYPITPGAYDSIPGGDADVFVAKVSAGADSLYFATFYGGMRRDIGTSIEVTSRGEVFVGGVTGSVDFEVTDCVVDSVVAGGANFWGGDFFLLKFDATGRELHYATALGGYADEVLPRMAWDNPDCPKAVVLAGSSNSPDYPTTPDAFQTQLSPAGTNFAVTLLREDLAAEIEFPADSCPETGVPFAFRANVAGCGHWTDLSQLEWVFGDGATALDSAVTHTYLGNGSYAVTLRQ
ncbi:MAG: PKD domain-containing protein, partial [Bacteroidota bacterium]